MSKSSNKYRNRKRNHSLTQTVESKVYGIRNDKEIFESISFEDRSVYRKKVIAAVQKKGQQKKFHDAKFLSYDWFEYKGCKLNYGYIEETQNPEALFFYFHGMYTHANTGGFLAHTMVDLNCNTNAYALDFKNSGDSEGGCPGYYESVDDMVEQARLFIEFIVQKNQAMALERSKRGPEKKTKEQLQLQQMKRNHRDIMNRNVRSKDKSDYPPFQKIKIFISGQSMGGLVAFKLTVLHPEMFDGLILLCPALKDCYEMIPYWKLLGRVIGYFYPTWKFLTQDERSTGEYENLDYMRKDKGMYLGKHAPGTGYALLSEMDNTHLLYSRLSTPYLVVQGGVDKSVDVFAPLDLEQESPATDKTTLYIEKMWHNILLDPMADSICRVCSEWVQDRVQNNQKQRH